MDEGKLVACHRCGKKIFLRKIPINDGVDSHYGVPRWGYASLPKGWSTVNILFYKYDADGDWTCTDLNYCPGCTEELRKELAIFGGYKGEYHGNDPLEEVWK